MVARLKTLRKVLKEDEAQISQLLGSARRTRVRGVLTCGVLT